MTCPSPLLGVRICSLIIFKRDLSYEIRSSLVEAAMGTPLGLGYTGRCHSCSKLDCVLCVVGNMVEAVAKEIGVSVLASAAQTLISGVLWTPTRANPFSPFVRIVLAARALQSRMSPVSLVLLARNIPYARAENRDGLGGVDVKGLSLRHEVCHRLLERRFLKGTSYTKEVRAVSEPPLLGGARTSTQIPGRLSVAGVPFPLLCISRNTSRLAKRP